MIKLPKNYGRICMALMVMSFIVLMICQTILYCEGKVDIAEVMGIFGTCIILFIFNVLAIPCIINYHTRKK
jgi:hypothetical protein